jgi:hypothetical protein
VGYRKGLDHQKNRKKNSAEKTVEKLKLV